MAPELSVVVASHDRPLRLRWLLNALEEQTLDRELWEVCVCHDSSGPETDELLRTHPLATAGVLRHTSLPPGSGSPERNRHAARALARAPAVVFTHDDCRPPERWLETVRDAVRRNPGAIVQGPVEDDPREHAMALSPYPRRGSYAGVPRAKEEWSNVVCPREHAEDAPRVGDERMVTYHAVEEGWLLTRVRDARRRRELAPLVRRKLGSVLRRG